METSYNCVKWCSATTYQKVNSSIASQGAMKSFNEMFPLASMFPLAIMQTPPFSWILTFHQILFETYMPLKKILRNFCNHLIIQCNLQFYLLTFNSSDKKYINKTINNWIDYYKE